MPVNDASKHGRRVDKNVRINMCSRRQERRRAHNPAVAVGVIYLLVLQVLPLAPAVKAILHGSTHCTHEVCRCAEHAGHHADGAHAPSVKSCHGDSQSALATGGIDKYVLGADVSDTPQLGSALLQHRGRLPALLVIRELIDPPEGTV